MSSPIVLTRPAGRNCALAAALRNRGHAVLSLPALALHDCDLAAQALPPLPTLDLLVFVSGYAARRFLRHLPHWLGAQPWPAHIWLATVGEASARPLLDSGLFAPGRIVYPPADALNHDSEALWGVLAGRLAGLRRALVFRGQSGREWLGRRLEEAGLEVFRVCAYERRPAVWPPDAQAVLRQWMQSGRRPVFLLTSMESTQAVHAQLQALGLHSWWPACRFVAFHQRIARHLQTILGLSDADARTAIVVCPPSQDALCMALEGQAGHVGTSLGLQSRHD